MKIAGRIFLTRNITTNTSDTFHARYKGHEIIVTSDHGHGKPEYDHLTRFDITVTDSRGCYAVDDWQDCHDIKSAVIKALDGALL